MFIPNRTILVHFGGISGEFGRTKIPMVRPNSILRQFLTLAKCINRSQQNTGGGGREKVIWARELRRKHVMDMREEIAILLVASCYGEFKAEHQ